MKIQRFVFNMVETNCYVVWDETGEAVIIDAGCSTLQEKEELKDFIEEQHLIVKHCLNTHLHFDHVMGNPFVEDTFGCKTEAGDGDIHWLTDIKRRASLFGIRYDEEPRPLGRVLNEGDTVTFGHHSIEVIHVPGHSPGSMAYYIPNEKALFSGDALFCESIGRTDFPDGDSEALQHAILTKLFTLPADTVVYPGHDVATTIGHEKQYNNFVG